MEKEINYHRRDYPKTIEELAQELFKVRKGIYELSKEKEGEIDEQVRAAVENIAKDTIQLFKDPQVKGYVINDWRTGLDLLWDKYEYLKNKK